MSQKQYAYLSGGIREGSLLRPQCQILLFKGGRSCAFGAAIEAIYATCEGPPETVRALKRLYPYINSSVVCPVCDERQTFWTVIGEHLNDSHDWTREQIADWLYAEEEKLGFITLAEETEAHNEMSLAITTVGSLDVVCSESNLTQSFGG